MILKGIKPLTATYHHLALHHQYALVQKDLKDLELFKSIGPIYKGNYGYLFVLCDKEKLELNDINPNLIKTKLVNKQLAIFNTRILKKITRNAVIKTINKIN